jgi:formate-dependent nitrite reductase membrane component NrfD
VAFVAGIASLAAFLALVLSTPGHNANLARVAAIDAVALVFAVVGLAAHLAQRHRA